MKTLKILIPVKEKEVIYFEGNCVIHNKLEELIPYITKILGVNPLSITVTVEDNLKDLKVLAPKYFEQGKLKFHNLKIGYFCSYKDPKDAQDKTGMVISFDEDTVVVTKERYPYSVHRANVTSGYTPLVTKEEVSISLALDAWFGNGGDEDRENTFRNGWKRFLFDTEGEEPDFTDFSKDYKAGYESARKHWMEYNE